MWTEADLCVCKQEAGLRCVEFFPLAGVIPAPGGVIEVLHVGLAQLKCPVQNILRQLLCLVKLKLQLQAIAVVLLEGWVVL